MKRIIVLNLLLISIFTFSQKKDSLIINFPAKYELELKQNQQNSTQIYREWIPKNETFENYTIIATQIVIKSGREVPFDLFKDKMVEGMKSQTENFKYTELKRSDATLIFKCESDKYIENGEKESQIYHLVKGKNDFFVNIIALKKNALPKDFVDEWLNVFNESKFAE